MNILIVGGGLQALSTGASLFGKGHILDVVSNDLQIRKSRYFNRVFSNVSSTNEDIYTVLKKSHYDVLLPMGDKNVAFLSKNKDYIESEFGCKCACPNYGLLSIVEDKHCFMDFCDKHDISHPVTIALTNESVEECAETVHFPALIKPDFSVGARGITRVDTLEELKDKYPVIFEKFGPCTLQEFIVNKDYYFNVMLYRTEDGRFLAQTIIKIVRMYPVTAGSSSCCISVDNKELLDLCKDCLNALDWVGMADFDVLQRLDNKEYKIIEINARVPASLKAAAISGVNFPEVISLNTMGLEAPLYEYRPGKWLRYLGLDIMWLLTSHKLFNNNPNWFQFFGRDVYYQDIYKQDSSTWWTWLAEGITKINKRNQRVR